MPSSAEQAFLQVVAERFDALDMDGPRTTRDPARCKPELLGHVAWSRGLDYWDSNWPEATKRQLATNAPANLRIRGTRAAVDNALSAFASDLLLEEWWEKTPEGAPGTATGTVLVGTNLGNSVEAQDTILRIFKREGRKSCHLTLILGLAGVASTALRSAGRVTLLSQHSGVQSGA